MLRRRTRATPVPLRPLRVTTIGKNDDGTTTVAPGGPIVWWVYKNVEIVLVSSVIDVHLGFDMLGTFWAFLPMAEMTF